MRARLAVLLALPTLVGCGDFFGNKDAYQPGHQLGTFHVVGTRTRNQCGEGALGTEPTWEFDVDLARDKGALYWDNGAQVLTGTLGDDDRTFSIEATVVVDMRTEDHPGYTPCSIERRDAVQGTLSEGEDVDAFAADLTYDFAPTAGSVCDDLVLGSETQGDAPVFAALPCGIAYALDAHRIAAPDE